MASPDKLIVNIHGDGSAGFHIGDLDTFAKFSLNIMTVVVNNSVWGMSQAGQNIMYGETTPQRPCVAMNPKVKYEVVAQGFGCSGAVVDVQENDNDEGEKTLGTLKEAVSILTESQGPSLLNLRVSDMPYQATTKSMVRQGPELICRSRQSNFLETNRGTQVGKNDDPNTIVIPYYDNIPRPHYR